MNQRFSEIKQCLLAWTPYILALAPILLFRDFTPQNELRYLAIADEALRDGHFWSFTFEGEPYADKPPLYLWLIMLSRVAWSRHVRWFICLFSLIPALGILHVMDRWTKPIMKSQSDAKLCQWMLATMGLQLGLAIFARMDMLMSFFIIWALYVYWQKRAGWLFGILLFLALFTKGPLGIFIPLVSTIVWAALSRDWSNVWNMWSWRTWLILLTGCIFWFGAVYFEAGSGYLYNLLFHQTIGRAVEAFHHQRPWWFYFAHIWYATLPWGPLCLVGLGQWVYLTIKTHRWRFNQQSYADNVQAFFNLSFLSTLILLSCLSGKLDVYLLPVFPFLAYGGMMQILKWKGFTDSWRKALLRACYGLMSVIFVAGILLAFIGNNFISL